MSRYFFNVLNDVRTNDEVGVELPDLKAAQREALKDIEDLRREHFETFDFNGWASWSIEVCDENGAVLVVVPFTKN